MQEFDELTALVKRSVAVREKARRRGKFGAADELRTLLADLGVELQDKAIVLENESASQWRWRTKPSVVGDEVAESPAPAEEEKLTQLKLKGGVVAKILETGAGSEAKKGQKVRVKYVGALKSTGKKFDSGKIDFVLGDGEVIQGWDLGVAGMLPKEKRRLKIPPAMAYGPRGSPPAIPPNATLIFDIQLIKILK